MDDLCRGREGNWTLCQQTLDRIESEARECGAFFIIDIGAGTQHRCQVGLQQYLTPRRQRVVLIYAQPSEAIQRNPLGPTRSVEEYRRTEYETRMALYSIADHRIVDVSGKSKDDAKALFSKFISEAFGVAAR